jgi:hypothetical protein
MDINRNQFIRVHSLPFSLSQAAKALLLFEPVALRHVDMDRRHSFFNRKLRYSIFIGYLNNCGANSVR